jgi:hypothetical protein
MPTIWTIWTQLTTNSYEKGKEFEETVKWFLMNDPKWKKKFASGKVFLWKESPHAWGQDNGVDLTAEDEDGAIWAIQAKAWHPNKKLTKGEIDSFLAESSRESIDFRLIVSTAKGMTKQLEQAIIAQEKEVKVILGHDLAKSRAPWDESKLFSNKKFARTPSIGTGSIGKISGCFSVLFGIFIAFLLLYGCSVLLTNGSSEDISQEPVFSESKSSQPNVNSNQSVETIIQNIPEGYEQFGKFYYKWIDKIPVNNQQVNEVVSRISVIGICSPELPDGAINSVEVSTEASAGNSKFVTGRGYAVWNRGNTYAIEIQYFNIKPGEGKTYKEVKITNISCRM